MPVDDYYKVLSYPRLNRLKTSLAIAQASTLLAELQREIEDTVSHDQAKRVTYLTELFSRIHRELFVDWKDQATVSHRPGAMPDADKRKLFRITLERLVLDDDDNQDTAIFDNNGFVIFTANIAERLSIFYQKMRAVRPFHYGNQITLDFFMVALGNLPAFKSVYPQAIDFRRLKANDAAALHDLTSSHDAVTHAFENALNPLLLKSLPNTANGYGKWPENRKFVLGIPFLSHTTEQGVDCLVTINGGLVPLAKLRIDLFLAGKQFADYPAELTEPVIGYLPGTEHLRRPKMTQLDGIRLPSNGSAPLFCLDINILSGLRAPGHTELLLLLKQCLGEQATIFELANNDGLKQRLLAEAGGDTRLQRGVEIAYERISYIASKLEAAKTTIFNGKTPVSHPHLFMSMGGAGSGKTAVEELAAAVCGDNFVIASLDEFRKLSDLYSVLTAASHHSDDYTFVEPFANRLRALVSRHARANRINILYDGTGIPYTPRYEEIIQAFASAGFATQLTAIDAFLVKPEGPIYLPYSSVIERVQKRFIKNDRALPWVVTIDKHIRAPGSFITALQHSALKKIALFANDGAVDQHYLVAESFDFNDEEIRAMQRHQLMARLSDYFSLLIRQHTLSVLKRLAHHDQPLITALLNRNPEFTEANLGYLVYHSGQTYRVLAIYNVRRMVDFIEKRQLNPNASGQEGLLFKPDSLAFHVNPTTATPWLTTLQEDHPLVTPPYIHDALP